MVEMITCELLCGTGLESSQMNVELKTMPETQGTNFMDVVRSGPEFQLSYRRSR